MKIIQIESIAILLKWILLGFGVLGGLGFMKVWLGRLAKDQSKELFDLLLNTLFIGFLIWKGSLILFDPAAVMKSFFSLIYFTGGSNGLLLAILFSILFFFFKARKRGIPNLMILQIVYMFGVVVTAIYHILFLLIIRSAAIFHGLLGIAALMILFHSLVKGRAFKAKSVFSCIIAFSFLYLILSFVYPGLGTKFFLFSADQWFYIGIIAFSVVYWDKAFPS